jgi:hypothetical protein
MTRDWWDTPPTRIHIRFTADQIHTVIGVTGNPRIQLDDGQNQVTIHPANAAALTELRDLIGILLDQLDTTRP